MAEPSFWEDAKKAQSVIEKSNALKSWVHQYDHIEKGLSSLLSLAVDAEGDEEVEILSEEVVQLEKKLVDLEVKKMLSKELDSKDAYLTINSGAGGTESCDWASMLARMYVRWAEKKNWAVEKVDFVPGDVTGFKSITFRFSGAFAYGYAKSEKGVHRLVRISPFDSNGKRHTSFASVDVIPVIEEEITLSIRPEDIRIDTFRASGAGGQHVNKTDSAVRITHMQTGITVSCQNERSQLQNKETCFRMLRSKLYEKEVLEREEKLRLEQGEKKDNAWGSQIRNYVFQPYTMVKDTRTKVESGNIQEVMDGDIDLFVNAFLKEYS